MFLKRKDLMILKNFPTTNMPDLHRVLWNCLPGLMSLYIFLSLWKEFTGPAYWQKKSIANTSAHMPIHYYWALLCNIKNFRKHEFFPLQISHSVFLNLIWRQPMEISILLLEYKIHAFASSKIKYLSLFSTVQSRKNSIRFGVVLEFIYEHHSVLTFNLCVFF